MNGLGPLGFSRPQLPRSEAGGTEYVVTQHALRRVLAFLGHSIDEVCNCPIVKGKVYGFYKLARQIDRSGEVHELERQWNPLGLRY